MKFNFKIPYFQYKPKATIMLENLMLSLVEVVTIKKLLKHQIH
jgi:hypothetical protein